MCYRSAVPGWLGKAVDPPNGQTLRPRNAARRPAAKAPSGPVARAGTAAGRRRATRPGSGPARRRRRVDKILMHNGIRTTGGLGLNLVIGELVELPANAIHVDKAQSSASWTSTDRSAPPETESLR